MRFRLGTVLWMFALLAAALAAFGVWGILVVIFVVSFWAVVFRLTKMTLVGWSISAAIVLLLVVMLMPAVSRARGPAYRSRCMNNLKQMSLAALSYQAVHGCLPQDIVDDEGNALLSWRVELLPYLEAQTLYDAIRKDEPWDSPSNRKLWGRMPEIFRCPGCAFACRCGAIACETHATNYFAVVGPQTVWTESARADWDELTQREMIVSEGSEKRFIGYKPSKLLFVETVIPESCWMQPVDLSVEEALEVFRTNKRLGHIGSRDNYFTASAVSLLTHVGTTDGHVELVYNDVDRDEVLERLVVGARPEIDWMSIEGSDPGSEDWVRVVYKWKRVYSFAMFCLLSLLPVMKLRRKDRANVAL